MSRVPFDLIVIGGGINGAGIARDAQMRGLKTLLLEKRDFAGGATGGSSELIHGSDAGYLQRIAPHLLFQIPFLVPLTDSNPAPKLPKPHTRLTPEQVRALEPGIRGELSGGVIVDGFGIDPFRLVVANAKAAQDAGAVVKNDAEVVAFLKVGDAVVGVLVRDGRTGVETEYRAPVTFNATGPWLTGLSAKAGVTSVKIRPSKGVHLVLDRRFSNVGISAPAIDGRMISIVPHDNVSLIGTTNNDYFGDPDRIPITADEVEYLLSGIESVLPEVRDARVIRAVAALRPTIYRHGKMVDDLSTEHRIYDHRELDQVNGLFSIAGGTLSAYRSMCEEAVDKVMDRLGLPPRASNTHNVPLPGAEEAPKSDVLVGEYGMGEHVVARLIDKHGARARTILERTVANIDAKTLLCACEGVTRAEIGYVVQHEWASTLSDVCRRTRLGMGPCQGCQCLVPAADVLAAEMKLSGDEYKVAVKEFYQDRFKGRRPVEAGDSLAQEELNYAIHVCVGNFDTLIG